MKVRKRLVWWLLSVLLLFCFTGCEKTSSALPEQEFTQEQEMFLYGYQTLTEEEQKIYRQWVKGLESFQEEITLGPVSGDRLEVIGNRIMIDHPEYFWTEGGFQYYEETKLDGSVLSVRVIPDYLMGEEEAELVRTQIELCAENWLSGVSSEADPYEKIKYVYETLIREVSYDENSENNQNIQSVFLNKSTVCMGYAKATQYLLNQMGVFCTLVTGTVTDGTDAGHAWNLVRIGESYYYVDTTWGNPGYSDSQNSGVGIYYSYLCCSEETLAPTHKDNGAIPLPPCLDDSYNYYKNKGCWYETFNRDQIDQVLMQSISTEPHTTEFRFASRDAYEQAAKEMVDGTLLQEAVQKSEKLVPGQQVSWQIYYGGWDNLIVIVWN